MMPTLNSYLDSVTNPVGHFTALAGIFPLRDPQGNAIFSVQTNTANFRVEWRGTNYILKCFLKSDPEVCNQARLICSHLARINSPYVTEYRYLESEIAVTSPTGRSSLHDVVLQRLGDGMMLRDLLLECCDRQQRQPVQALMGHVAAMAEFMSDKGLVHRNIKPSNVFVSRQYAPVLLNYDFAQRFAGEIPAAGPNPLDRDNLALACLAAGLYLLACEPSLYRNLGQQNLFTPSALLGAADAIPSALLPASLHLLFARIRSAEGTLAGRAGLNALLHELSLEKIVPGILRPEATHSALPASPAQEEFAAPRPALDLSQYAAAGETSEMLTCVQTHDGRWFYLGADGLPAWEQTYDAATDFEEGRAVVGVGPYETLIDRQGRQLIPLRYESVEWDALSGTASVSLDGKWGLHGRDGELLAEPLYDWLSKFQEGLLLARLDSKYGFLDRRGGVAFPFIYDEASSFSHGRAPVSVRGKTFTISLDEAKTDAEK